MSWNEGEKRGREGWNLCFKPGNTFDDHRYKTNIERVTALEFFVITNVQSYSMRIFCPVYLCTCVPNNISLQVTGSWKTTSPQRPVLHSVTGTVHCTVLNVHYRFCTLQSFKLGVPSLPHLSEWPAAGRSPGRAARTAGRPLGA